MHFLRQQKKKNEFPSNPIFHYHFTTIYFIFFLLFIKKTERDKRLSDSATVNETLNNFKREKKPFYILSIPFSKMNRVE